MELTAPSRFMDVYPTLKPLMDAVKSPEWVTSKGATHGCALATLESATLPTKAFRMSVDVSANIETVVHVVRHPDFLRQYDPTLDRCDILEEQQAGTLLYTSYKHQSWLVAPRDFCVLSANVLMDAVAAKRRKILSDGTTTADDLNHLVYVQNNIDSPSNLCPPGCRGSRYVRGLIHFFGYVVYELPGGGGVRVDNYCCVEPGGSVPIWVANAAIGQNCEKLQKIRKLACQLQQSSPCPRIPRGSTTTSGAASSAPAALSDLGQPESSFFPPPQTVDTQVYASATFEAATDEPRRSQTTERRQHEEEEEEEPVAAQYCAQETTSTTAVVLEGPSVNSVAATELSPSPLSLESLRGQTSHQGFHTPLSSFPSMEEGGSGDALNDIPGSTTPHPPPVTSSGEVTTYPLMSPNGQHPLRTAMAASSPVPHEPPPCDTPVHAQRPEMPFTRWLSALTSQQRESAVQHLSLSDDADVDLMAKRLCCLSRCFGWVTVREEDGCVVEALERLPDTLVATFPPLQQDELRHNGVGALRVSAVVHGSLDATKEVFNSNALAPDMDAALSRITNTSNREHGRDARAPDGELRRWQLRHYIYDQTRSCPAWDLAVRCADVEVPQGTGALLGLHASGVRAGSYVWGSLDAGESVVRDPHKVHRRATAFIFGWTAVAIPVTADTCRITHYASIAVLPWTLNGTDAVVAGFCAKENQGLQARVTKSMLARIQGLRELVRRNHPAPQLPLSPRLSSDKPVDGLLEGTPLLVFLADVDERLQNAMMSSTCVTVSFRDSVADGEFTLSTSATGGPLSLHVSLVFPCALTQFADYVLCARQRMRSLDPHVGRVSLLSDRSRCSAVNGPNERTVLGSAPCSVSVFEMEFTKSSRLRPNMHYSVMECAGELVTGDRPTFVLARTNCVVTGDTTMRQNPMPPTAPHKRPKRGNVYYDGYVARAGVHMRNDTTTGMEDTMFTTVTRHMCVDLPGAVSNGLLRDFFPGSERDTSLKSCPGGPVHPAVRELIETLQKLRASVAPLPFE